MPAPIDPVASIKAFNAGGDPERLVMKYAAMRKSRFSFFRGTAHLFYARMPEPGSLKDAPLAWACGDLHLENFGSYAGESGQVYFDINDFDEALLAPCIWDVVRMVASIRTARKDLGITREHRDALCTLFVDAYAKTLEDGKARWIERETATGIIGELLMHLTGKSRAALIQQRTLAANGRRRLRVDGIRALKISAADREFVERLFKQFSARNPLGMEYTLLDAARRIAGTGSLGVERYVALVRQRDRGRKMHLIDVKRTRPSSSVARAGLTQPVFDSEAHRAVAIQYRCQAATPPFLAPIVMDQRPFVLRELQPREDRLDLAGIAKDAEHLDAVLAMMGQLVAWGQLRSSGRQGAAVADALISFGAARKWRKKLLDMANDAADTVKEDWQAYCDAYDAGVFGAV
jgi:uncharacterized protein (DUF2252 family)